MHVNLYFLIMLSTLQSHLEGIASIKEDVFLTAAILAGFSASITDMIYFCHWYERNEENMKKLKKEETIANSCEKYNMSREEYLRIDKLNHGYFPSIILDHGGEKFGGDWTSIESREFIKDVLNESLLANEPIEVYRIGSKKVL